METRAASEGTRLAEVARDGARRLRHAGIASPQLDARLLLCEALGLSCEQLVLSVHRPLSSLELHAYDALLERRCNREPLAYIVGRREFWSMDFLVTPVVLIPRPETERLVEIALKLAGELGSRPALRIVDIGTGSGAVAVALARELPSAAIFAVDISSPALALAAQNAARNGLAGNIEFIQSDLLAALPDDFQFDLVVSNPPYIRRGEIHALEPEVSGWEPRAALDGGSDGLDYYRRIAVEAFSRLRPNGALAVEIGADMGRAVAAIFGACAACAQVEIYRDYAGYERVAVARKAPLS